MLRKAIRKEYLTKVITMLSVILLLGTCFSAISLTGRASTTSVSETVSTYAVLKWQGGYGSSIGKYNSIVTAEEVIYTELFQDDFESGSIDKWAIEQELDWETPITIVSAPVYNGSYSARFYGYGWVLFKPVTLTPIQQGEAVFDFAIRYDRRGSVSNYFYFWAENEKVSYIEFVFTGGGTDFEIRWYPDANYTNYYYLLQKGDIGIWYHFQVNLNLDEKSVRIIINNVERSGKGLPSGLNSIKTWEFDYVGGYTEVYLDSVKVGKIDKERYKKIIFGNEEGFVYKLGYCNGDYREEWHTQLNPSTFGIALGDVTGDYVPEIIVGTYNGYLYVLDTSTGETKWKTSQLGWMLYGLAVGDIDNDGTSEIIAGDYNGYLYAINSVTHLVEWQSDDFGAEFFEIVVDDLDYDGTKEIIVGGYNGNLMGHVYIFDGITKILKWQSEELWPCLYNIIIDDIDYDGTKEIITASAETRRVGATPAAQDHGYIYIFDGVTYAMEWKKGPLGYGLWGMAIGDTNQDGVKEIVAGVWSGEVYAFESVTYALLWKEKYVIGGELTALRIGDVNGDNKAEIVIGTEGHVMVFDPTFHIKMWQDNTPGHRIYGVAVGDIDGDSIREIVACDTEGEMYVYDTINYTLEWKMTIGGGTLFPLKIIDIDNDNIEDIIVTWRNPISEHDHVFVINRITHTIKWQLNFTDICFVKVADLENDGVNDIFVTHGKYLSVVDTITKILKGQILITDQMYALDVKDLDGDGSNEIIVGSSAGYLYIYNSDFTQRYYTDFVYLSPNVVVAGDSDSDGIKEIIIGAHDNRYMVGVGRILVLNGIDYSVEWESEPLWGIEWRPNFVVGLAIADVDQDGTYEIIASDRNYLYAFDGITKKMEWKSEQLSAYPVAEEHTIIAFDIDEDYQNEVIVGSRGYVYVFGIGVIGIDLVILDREIRFSDTAPSIGQTITISAIIHNKGRNATQNIVVRFFDNDVLINAATLPLVPGNNQETVATSWVVSGGHHVIRVVADPDNAVDEFNEGNNFASKQISINIPPVADAGPAQTVNIQTLVQFLGVGRDPDGRIVKYEWDFDGDGIFDWESVITGSTAYIYTQFGTYEAVLRVTDNDGAAGIDTCTISVVSIVGAPPVALPGLNQTVAFVDGKAVVTVDGSASYDPDGGRIIKYDWNWRDLTPHNISTSPTATHIYTVPGLYEIVLTVTDESGLTGNNVTYIKVSYPPRAYAGEDKEQRVSWVVNFDDCWGYDPDGIITKYDWNFGDGTTWSSTISPRTNHIYTLSGTYVATLTVTNGDGLEINAASLTATDSCLVTIVDNFPPVADAGPDRQIRYDRIIQFNGAGSYDKDGYIVSYYWDFGDGQFSYELAPIHVYHVPGNYTVILTVTDNEGATGSDTCTVRVTGNENPIANAGSDRIAYVNQEITFDGSASYDPDGYIVSYVWDLGDGTSATGISATHAYSIGNTIYYVRLTVTDNDGATGSDVCIVTVITNLGPEASLFANLYPFYQVTLRWKPVTFQARAYDPDGYIVKYEWCFGDGPPTEVYTQGAPSSVSSEVTHSFGGSKDYNVEYTVTFTAWDNQGAKVTARAWVYVLSNRKPVLYAGEDRAKYVNEALNKSWNKTVTFLILALDPDGELTKIDVDFGDGTPIQQCIAQSKNLSAEETEALLQKLTVTIPPELPFESLLRESGWLVRESLHYFFGEILEDTLVDIIGEFIPVEASKGTRILLLIFVVATGIAGVITTVLGAKKLCDEAYESGRRCSIDKFKYSLQYYWEVKLGLREPGYILNKTEIAKRLRVCAVNHTYQEIGEYLVNVKVYDNDSAEDNESFRLILYDNIPPAGSSETGIGRANSPTNIMFIGRDFENNIARFEIDFGDGTSETILATDPRISLSVHRYFPDMEHTVYNLSATLTHIYTKGGIYNVTLKIVDEKGANFTITKKAKIYPLADAGPDKTVKVNKPAEFKGTGWTLDADFKKFWWDCNQDGVEDATWINETKIAKATTVGVVTGRFDTIYTYTTIRVYNATFGLRDTLDALAEDICVVTVVANEPPVANAGPDRFARYYTSVMFDGSKSYDVDGIIVNYTWEFGDGGVGYGVNTTHVYTTLGTYIVTLTVKDDDGDTNSDTCTVNVTDNLPPIANAGPDQYVYVHQIVQFNGSASFDPDGNIANYTWNFNDPYNQTPGYGATPMHIYTHPGIYTVTLTVTDDKGAKAMDICLVYVYNNLPPEVDPGTDQIRPFGYPVNFYATAKDSDDRIVKMEWDYGDGKKDTKLLDETGIVTWDTKHMYCVPHGYENLTESITIKYNATLTVWDNRGGVSSRTCIIEMRLDLRPPAISNFSLPAKEFSYTRGIVNFTFEITDDAAPPEFLRGYVYLDDNLYDKTYLDLTALSVGEHTLSLTAVDWICRESVEIIRFTVIDDVAPYLNIISPESREYFYIEGPINITYYAYDEKDLHPEITILLDGTIFTEDTINLMALAPGNHTLTIRAMDASGNIVERSVTFTLVKKAIILDVNDVIVQYSDTAVLSAILTEALGPVSNREVLFFVDRMYIGKALTDSSGRANLSYTFDLPPKPYTLTVIFYGDYYYLPSTAEAEIKILKEDTTLTYIGNLAGQYSDNVTLSAVLVDQDTNIGISNKTISFKLEKQTVFASTNESGIATIIISLIQLPAQYNLTVTFSGDDYYLKSENVSIFTVEKEDTVLIAYDVLVIDPINNTLIATLLEDGCHIVSRNINFYINSTYVGLGFTNESGMAVYPIPFIYLFGNFTYTAEFAGDPYYLPSNDSAVLDTTYDARVKAITTQITNLIESIQNSTIDQGTKNSLISKLQNARSKVYQENFNAANNIMNAFQNELNAQRGKKIPEELYQTWYAQSEMIRYGLQWMMAH